jgi:GAF domain-containing protein
LVDNCHNLLDVDSAGIMLANLDAELEVVASTSEANELIEMMQFDADAGPCMECFRTASVVSVPDVASGANRWPAFSKIALQQGVHSVIAIPLKLRDTTIGTLNLMRDNAGELNHHDRRAAQALADVATIGIIHERTVRQESAVRDQLQDALSSRVVIEQAKGVVAETREISTEDAFRLIRDHSRSTRESLSSVAQRIVGRTLRL